jgi:hypothetical protein
MFLLSHHIAAVSIARLTTDGGTSATCITNCLNDRTVAGHQLGNGEQTESDWEVHSGRQIDY